MSRLSDRLIDDQEQPVNPWDDYPSEEHYFAHFYFQYSQELQQEIADLKAHISSLQAELKLHQLIAVSAKKITF